MSIITMKNFMSALISGELTLNEKDENGKAITKTIPIYGEDGKLIPEITDYAKEQIENIDKRTNANRKGNNEILMTTLLNILEADKPYTAKEIVELGIEGIPTPQKVSYLMRELVSNGKVLVEKGKVNKYTVIKTS